MTETQKYFFTKAIPQQCNSTRWSVYSYVRQGKTNFWKQTFTWPEKFWFRTWGSCEYFNTNSLHAGFSRTDA